MWRALALCVVLLGVRLGKLFLKLLRQGKSALRKTSRNAVVGMTLTCLQVLRGRLRLKVSRLYYPVPMVVAAKLRPRTSTLTVSSSRKNSTRSPSSLPRKILAPLPSGSQPAASLKM